MPKGPRRGDKAKPVRRSAKAGLILDVGRTSSMMKKARLAQRVGAAAPVYLAAVLQYLLTELIDQGGEHATEAKGLRINPKHLARAIRNDEELTKLCCNTQISGGGHGSSVHKVLFPKNKVEE